MDERKEIYDEICRQLTDFENARLICGDDFVSPCNNFYELLVKIQNKWEDVITAR